LIFKISSTSFGQIFAHHQERKNANYSMWYGVLLWWWVGGQEGGSVVLCAWCEGRCLTADYIRLKFNIHGFLQRNNKEKIIGIR
jgi:hypothetical protein